MKTWLRGKLFGMPRWAFIALLVGGVALGLYLRARKRAQDSTANPPPSADTGTLDGQYGGEAAGLAGVGVASPPGGVYPVSSPVIPEGFGDIIGSLTGVISDISTREPNAIDSTGPAGPQGPPGPTGGGPPTRPPGAHRPAGVSRKEATRRVTAIARRHGTTSPAAKRAAQRLGVTVPKRAPKAKRR